MTMLQRAGHSNNAGGFSADLQRTPSTLPQSTLPIPVGKPTPKTWSTPAEEESIFRAYYDIGPERTDEDFRRVYDAMMTQLTPHLDEYVDIDLPIVDSGGDW